MVVQGRNAIELSNGEVFASKKALKERVKAILYGWPKYEPLTGMDAKLILALFERHPEHAAFAASGVKMIGAQIEDNIERTIGFHLMFDDGRKVGWSYYTAIDGKHGSQKADAKKALRAVIQPQLRQVKDYYIVKHGDDGRAPCQHTGGMFDRNELHVDHCGGLTFQKIVDDYCARYGVDLNAIVVVEKGDRGRIRPADDAEARRFYWYHQCVAIVRLLCEQVHQRARPADRLYGAPIWDLIGLPDDD